MSAHTPGPWKVIVVGAQWGIAIAKKRARQDMDDICMGSRHHPDWQANTALLAAAPALLAALEQIAATTQHTESREIAKRAIRAATKPTPDQLT